MDNIKADILAAFAEKINFSAILELRKGKQKFLDHPQWGETKKLLSLLPTRADLDKRGEFFADYSLDSVTLGPKDLLTAEEEETLRLAVENLIPWRKGPFELFGMEVDSEWRSNLKWDRVKESLGDLSGQHVADVGCGNAYYMHRALELNPKFIIGLDPSIKCYFTCAMLNRLTGDERLQYELMGVEHLDFFPEFFDTVLCMGVIYHRRDPLEMLRVVKNSLRPGGTLIIESQVIPGEEHVSLTPVDRYAKARNVYFVPTANCLAAWLEKSGFVDVEIFSVEKTTFEEQRQTKFSPGESLRDFLDKDDVSKTVEGYPAPLRACVRGRRKK